jgi:hypothetical protein
MSGDIVLRLNMINYGAMVAGFTVPVLASLRMTATVDLINWMNDWPWLLDLIRHSPVLQDLSIECNDLPRLTRPSRTPLEPRRRWKSCRSSLVP